MPLYQFTPPPPPIIFFVWPVKLLIINRLVNTGPDLIRQPGLPSPPTSVQ